MALTYGADYSKFGQTPDVSKAKASDNKYYKTEQTQTPTYSMEPVTTTSSTRREPSYSRTTGYSSSTAIPTMPRPTMGALPEYQKPEYDEERVGELREISMSVPMSRLQRALNRTLMETRYAGNKAVRGQMTRQALSGYGEGISNIGLAAQKEAMSQYGPEYSAEQDKARMTYAASLDKYKTEFESNMNEYLATMKRTQSTSGTQSQTGGGTTSTGTSMQRVPTGTTTKTKYAMNPAYSRAGSV